MLLISLTVILVLRGLLTCAAQGIQADFPNADPAYSTIFNTTGKCTWDYDIAFDESH